MFLSAIKKNALTWLRHEQLLAYCHAIFFQIALKPMWLPIQISRRMVSSGISGVAFALVYSEKTCLKKLMIMIIIITNKSQEMTVFGRRQKLTSLRPEK